MSVPRHTANGLTIFRILLIPIIVGLFYLDAPVSFIAAAALFSIACLTDYFDGWVARQANQVTPLGRFLDPLADKLLIASTLVMLVGFNRITGITLIPVVVILCREMLVSGLREYLGAVQVSLPVSELAKWKTTLQMVGIGCLIVGDNLGFLPLNTVGQTSFWISAVLTTVTGLEYFRASIRHLR